jgi:hypothetical protein
MITPFNFSAKINKINYLPNENLPSGKFFCLPSGNLPLGKLPSGKQFCLPSGKF